MISGDGSLFLPLYTIFPRWDGWRLLIDSSFLLLPCHVIYVLEYRYRIAQRNSLE